MKQAHNNSKHIGSGLCLSVITLSILISSTASAKLYRWVDENNKVHYGEAIPTRYKAQQYAEVDKMGVTRKTHISHKEKMAIRDAEMEREKKNTRYNPEKIKSALDASLVSTFNSAKEVEDKYQADIEQLQKEHASLSSRLKTNRDNLSKNKELASRPENKKYKRLYTKINAKLESNIKMYEEAAAENLEKQKLEMARKETNVRRYKALMIDRD